MLERRTSGSTGRRPEASEVAPTPCGRRGSLWGSVFDLVSEEEGEGRRGDVSGPKGHGLLADDFSPAPAPLFTAESSRHPASNSPRPGHLSTETGHPQAAASDPSPHHPKTMKWDCFWVPPWSSRCDLRDHGGKRRNSLGHARPWAPGLHTALHSGDAGETSREERTFYVEQVGGTGWTCK